MTVRGKATEQAKETLFFQTMRPTETQFCSWSSLKLKTGGKIKAKAGAFWGCLMVLRIKPRVLYRLGSYSPLSCILGQTLHRSVLITFNLFTWGEGRYVYHGTCMEMRKIGSPLIPCGSWGWNSGRKLDISISTCWAILLAHQCYVSRERRENKKRGHGGLQLGQEDHKLPVSSSYT